MKTRVILFLAGILTTGAVLAADWPQWQGPDRTNISKETGLLKTWPKDGPKLLWTYEKAGLGFSGPAVVGDRIYTMGARDGKDYILALDARSGTEAWASEVGKLYTNGWGDGPRCTPAVDGKNVYAIGGQGDVVCVDMAKGNRVWSKSMPKDFGGKVMSGWGFCESPLVDGDTLVCTPGGSQGTFAALDKKTGAVKWRSKDITDACAYSSIIIAEIGGVKQYINMTGTGVASVAAKDGKLLWTSSEGKNSTAIIPTPIYHDGQVYVTSGYGCGCALLKIEGQGGAFKAEKAYANKIMANHHGGVVLVDGHIYGYSDSSRGGWVCQDLKSGKTVWEEKDKLKKGSLTCADGKLYCFSERDGTVALIDAAPTGWKESGRMKLPRTTSMDRKKGQIWTHPVVADGKLYLRDQELIFCFDIRGK